tara:strand:- start:30 stop:272 length:243 start_codon:yes stop_codon:yes gene_type:complete
MTNLSGVAGKTVTGSESLKTKALEASECGAIGVSWTTGQSGVITGPPALNEYAVDPVGVDKITPSAEISTGACLPIEISK